MLIIKDPMEKGHLKEFKKIWGKAPVLSFLVSKKQTL